jgi:hypothetical protein
VAEFVTLVDRKRTGLSALGTALGTAKRSGHSFVMLRISDAEEIHDLVAPVMKREQHRIYMRQVRALKRAMKGSKR